MYGNQMPYLQAVTSDKNYKFNTRAKFMLIEQIRHINIYRKIYNEKLKQKKKLLDINTRNSYA